jgi:hypothetical protein
MDQLSNPAFATPIGLLIWGANHLHDEPVGYANGTGPGIGRVWEWLKNLFPG